MTKKPNLSRPADNRAWTDDYKKDFEPSRASLLKSHSVPVIKHKYAGAW